MRLFEVRPCFRKAKLWCGPAARLNKMTAARGLRAGSQECARSSIMFERQKV
jgi:hypothetical protein